MSEQTALSVDGNRWAWIRHNPLIDLGLLLVRPRAVPTTSPTVSWIKRHPLLALVSLAYGLTWIGAIPFIADSAVAAQRGTLSLATIIVVFLMLGGCLWAAFIVETAVGRASGDHGAGRSGQVEGHLGTGSGVLVQ